MDTTVSVHLTVEEAEAVLETDGTPYEFSGRRKLRAFVEGVEDVSVATSDDLIDQVRDGLLMAREFIGRRVSSEDERADAINAVEDALVALAPALPAPQPEEEKDG